MQERLVAFFATRDAAEEAAAALQRSHAPEAVVQILHAEEGVSFAPKDSRSAKRRREAPDFMDRVRSFLAEVGLLDARRAASLDDAGRNCFEEGLCRGGVVLRVDVDADQAQETMNLLARHEALDVTEFAGSWSGRTRVRKRETDAQEVGAVPKRATRAKALKTEAPAMEGTRRRTTKKPVTDDAMTVESGNSRPASGIAPEMRDRMIAEEAYHLAEQRGFAGDLALEDWLEAERLVDARLKTGRNEGSGSGA